MQTESTSGPLLSSSSPFSKVSLNPLGSMNPCTLHIDANHARPRDAAGASAALPASDGGARGGEDGDCEPRLVRARDKEGLRRRRAARSAVARVGRILCCLGVSSGAGDAAPGRRRGRKRLGLLSRLMPLLFDSAAEEATKATGNGYIPWQYRTGRPL